MYLIKYIILIESVPDCQEMIILSKALKATNIAISGRFRRASMELEGYVN